MPESGPYVPLADTRVEVVSDCRFQGQQGRVTYVETDEDYLTHVVLDGERIARSFWSTELTDAR